MVNAHFRFERLSDRWSERLAEMETPAIGHRYAIVKLYQGLDEVIFEKLLKGLGLAVVFTNDPSNCNQNSIREKTIPTELKSEVQSMLDPFIREYANLLRFIEANINADVQKPPAEITGHKVTVECKVGKPIVLCSDALEKKTVTCMLCKEEVLRERSAIKSHVQSHSGKRYGCDLCKYHTDRKFDFTRHVRRRHAGQAEPPEIGCRPHWMTMLKSCFPTYGDVGKYRKIRKMKIEQKVTDFKNTEKERQSSTVEEYQEAERNTSTSGSSLNC
ncbi:unnamed protein product [Cylicocyclus nassatus]|uniref:C2H2-type domain-containing protein n=1 Tax=Cylicocyclus nassatus TaxID=53992 RepID=A0AA36DPY1_CYLNA|nr:unnamed protein product [Cylicocyclus nassatus]